jgi:cell wall-associated NlpC family hydrolase
MKVIMSLKNQVLLLTVIVILGSCTGSNKSALISEITVRVDSLKQIYAPDQRIALWNVSIKGDTAGISIVGEVNDMNGQSDLVKLKSSFPNLKIEVKLLPENHAGYTNFGIVNNSVCNIRAEGRYAAEMVNQTLLGTPVKVFKKVGGFSLIQTPNQYFGWISNSSIVLLDSARLKEYQTAKKIVYDRQFGFSYSKPDAKSQAVSDLAIGCILQVTGTKNNYFEVKYPDDRIAYVNKDEVIDLDVFFNKTPIEKELVETAKKFNGIPYLWGGFSSKAIDCSGFSSIIYLLNGIILPRDASQQAKTGKEITTDFISTNLLVGDLLFFGRKKTDSLPERVTHAAIYIGNDDFMQSSGRVKISSMDTIKENYDSENAQRFVRAVRIIGQENGNTIQRIKDNNFYTILR